jgi:predicted PurR-regulated permease PerM
MGLFLAVALSGPVEWLHRHKVPRAATSILILVVILAALILSGYLFLPTLVEQTSQVASALPSAFSRLESLVDRTGVPVGLSSPSSSTMISWSREPAGGALGLFSGIVEFVPYFGPVISAIPPMLLALVGNPVDALWVALAYLAIQQAEGDVITPLVIHQATSLHPVVVIAAVTLAGAGFGVMGALIAVPTAVVIMVLIEELWFRRVEGAASDHPQEAEASVRRTE